MKTLVSVTTKYEVEYDHPDNLAHVMRCLKTENFSSVSGAAMIKGKSHGYHAKKISWAEVKEIPE